MAKLSNILISGFRNVSIKEFDFDSRYFLTGKNMTGKTNTLNAICWALTGTDLEGSNDTRANFTKGFDMATGVQLTFDGGDFVFCRKCEMVDGTPKVSIFINGVECKSIKEGEARLHAKLGLTDLILDAPKGFDIVRFLINPLYFDTISPSALRKFLYYLAKIDFKETLKTQSKAVCELVSRSAIYDPYLLCESIDKNKKSHKKTIDGIKTAVALFPSVKDEAEKKLKEENKWMVLCDNDAALADKYALTISKVLDKYYEKALGLKVRLLEKGVGDDVYKDVCYPILPKSGLPFHLGSQAEKTYVGVKFIQELCLKFNIKPLPILLDNMESLDENTRAFIDELGVEYIGALVK